MLVRASAFGAGANKNTGLLSCFEPEQNAEIGIALKYASIDWNYNTIIPFQSQRLAAASRRWDIRTVQVSWWITPLAVVAITGAIAQTSFKGVARNQLRPANCCPDSAQY